MLAQFLAIAIIGQCGGFGCGSSSWGNINSSWGNVGNVNSSWGNVDGLYAFENNVLWTFSIPAFSGQGLRYYLIGQYDFSPRLTSYIRFARTSYTDRESISSGLQTIEGPKQTETTLLLRYMLHQ